jgi:Phospholipase_D-nuclease N-terminal
MALAANGSGYPLLGLFWTMLIFFGFVLWFWLLAVVFGDLFHRDDASGWTQAVWTVFMVVLPFIGVLSYLIAQGKVMGERRREAAVAARMVYEADIRSITGEGSQAAGQIATAKRLLDAGAVTRKEYEVLKRRALGMPTAGTTGEVN